MIKVKLDSDFVDYYDHHMDFDGDLVLSRRMKAGPNRMEMYKLLNMIGLKTPKFGMVAELYKDLGTQNGGVAGLKASGYGKLMEVVVFTDVNAHAGDGKLKMSLDEAREKFPGHFAAQFIPTAKTYASRTERVVVAGDYQYWLEYKSMDDWRSNAGETTIAELDTRFRPGLHGNIHEIKSPLYAIDFVAVGNERLAIDLNVSPGLKGTPIEDIVTAEHMAGSIKSRLAELRGVRTF